MSFESVKIVVEPATVENVGITAYPIREFVSVKVTPAAVGYSEITSTSNITIGTGVKTFTLTGGNAGAFVTGQRIRAIHTTTPTYWMEGYANYIGGGTLILTVDLVAGSGTHNAWNFAIAGQVGATGAQGPQGPQGPTGGVSSVAGRTGAVTLVSADITDATSAATANTLVKRDANGSAVLSNVGIYDLDSIGISYIRVADYTYSFGNNISINPNDRLLSLLPSFLGSTLKTYTFPDSSGTVALTDVAQSWSGTQTFSGAMVFTSTTRPTAPNVSGTPAATSLITRDDGDARFGSFLGIPITQASTASWGGGALGLLPFTNIRPEGSGPVSTFASSPPDVRFMPYWVPSTRTITSAIFKIISGTNATQTVRGAIYDTGADGMPNNRMGSQFSWACSATGLITASTGSITLNKGLYWLAMQNSVGSTTWGGTLTVLAYPVNAFSMTAVLLGTPVSGWDQYRSGGLPKSSTDTSMPALGANFAVKGFTEVSAGSTYPAVLLY
jgi:hypothetical protein